MPSSLGMAINDVEIETLTGAIIAAAIEVHRELGPGLLESVYKTCLVLELRSRGFAVDVERRVQVTYRDVLVESHLAVDMVVGNTVVLEVKSVSALVPIHSAQVLTYLRRMGCPAGLLLNFNVEVLRHGIRRLVHPDLYRRRTALHPPRFRHAE